MTGSANDFVLGRQLENVSTKTKQYILAELLTLANAVAADIANAAPTDFTGAGLSTAGLSGLVPAPSAGDVSKFLRADGQWSPFTIGTTSSTVEGAFWLEDD